MGVGRHGRCGIGDQKTARHAEVDDPLRFRGRSLGFGGLGPFARFSQNNRRSPRAGPRGPQLTDNVLARAMDGENDAAQKTAGKFRGRGLEGLRVRTEPSIENSIAADPFVDGSSDGFHFGEFGHRSIIASPQVSGRQVVRRSFGLQSILGFITTSSIRPRIARLRKR